MRFWVVLELVFVLLLVFLLALWVYVGQSARYSDFCEEMNYQAYGLVDGHPACLNSFDNNIAWRFFRDMGENDIFFIEPEQTEVFENWNENWHNELLPWRVAPAA